MSHGPVAPGPASTELDELLLEPELLLLAKELLVELSEALATDELLLVSCAALVELTEPLDWPPACELVEPAFCVVSPLEDPEVVPDGLEPDGGLVASPQAVKKRIPTPRGNSRQARTSEPPSKKTVAFRLRSGGDERITSK